MSTLYIALKPAAQGIAWRHKYGTGRTLFNDYSSVSAGGLNIQSQLRQEKAAIFPHLRNRRKYWSSSMGLRGRMAGVGTRWTVYLISSQPT